MKLRDEYCAVSQGLHSNTHKHGNDRRKKQMRSKLMGMVLAVIVFVCGCVEGDAYVVSRMPSDPGFPEGVAINGGLAYVSAPAVFGNAGTAASTVYEVDLVTGNIQRAIEIDPLIQDPSEDHALVALAFDSSGRLYVLAVPGGMIRLTFNGNSVTQEVYATFPDLLPCYAVEAGDPCSTFPVDLPPLPNDLVFAPDGSAYVTDSLQAVIWKVPPGGGEAEIWFSDPALIADTMGVNGIALSLDRQDIYFSVTLGGSTGGYIYKMPFVATPDPDDMEVFHHYALDEGPDGMVFGQSGKLYVTLSVSDKISVLLPDGSEEQHFDGPCQALDGGDPVPFSSPATVAFVDGLPYMLVVNHGYLSLEPEHWILFGLLVNDLGDPLERPVLP